MMAAPVIDVRELRTQLILREGVLPVLDGVSFQIHAGEILGLVGESGSGKSVTALAIMGLLDPPGRVAGGAILHRGRNLLGLRERDLRSLRGNSIAMVFQDPMMTLNPVLRIGVQITEALHAHQVISRADAWARARDALAAMGIASAEERLAAYPHQLSGGMRQRVAIAIALLHRPDLVIADEPTTALDATIQSQILAEFRSLVREHRSAVLWITHDLSVIADLADRVAVMYAGRILEDGPAQALLARPRHPYTAGLLASVPGGRRRMRLPTIPGSPPPLAHRPEGCVFRPRCPRASTGCHVVPPIDQRTEAGGRRVACFHPCRGAAE